MLWLAACLGALAVGVAWPQTARIALGLILVATNAGAMRRGVLLRGPRAIRRLEWDEAGRFRIWPADPTAGWPGVLRPASFRLGIACLMLWFSTPAGHRWVLIDGRAQDPIAFRRLARLLARGMLIPSGPKV
jgi:hypothetical protein